MSRALPAILQYVLLFYYGPCKAWSVLQTLQWPLPYILKWTSPLVMLIARYLKLCLSLKQIASSFPGKLCSSLQARQDLEFSNCSSRRLRYPNPLLGSQSHAAHCEYMPWDSRGFQSIIFNSSQCRICRILHYRQEYIFTSIFG